MRRVFIDLGAYDGDTIKEFFNWGQIINNPHEFEIYAFEPNPNLEKQMLRIQKQTKNLTFKPWAAWTFDGLVEMAADGTDTPMGSTLMPGKQAIWDSHPHVTVKAFDFSKWLNQKFTVEDFVIIKMDIEGAEFPVLKKMVKDGTIRIPNLLFVEFHQNKVKEYTTQYKNAFVQELVDAGVNIRLWH